MLLQLKQADADATVRFTTTSISGAGPCEQLFSLVEDEGRRLLVLNFTGVERLDSAFIARLIQLHKTLKAAGGRLALCGLGPALSGTFRTLQLHRMLNIYSEEEEALRAMNGK